MSIQEALAEQFIKKIDFEKLGLKLVGQFHPAELLEAFGKAFHEHADEIKAELDKDYDGDGVKNSDELKRAAAANIEAAQIVKKMYGAVNHE